MKKKLHFKLKLMNYYMKLKKTKNKKSKLKEGQNFIKNYMFVLVMKIIIILFIIILDCGTVLKRILLLN